MEYLLPNVPQINVNVNVNNSRASELSNISCRHTQTQTQVYIAERLKKCCAEQPTCEATVTGTQLAVHRVPATLRNKVNNSTPHYQRTKMSKKQLKIAQAQKYKETQSNLHLHALFAAVENGHLEKARTILESTDVDINSINADGLSVLDVAVLSNNRSMTKMLLQHGAIEGAHCAFGSAENIGTKLDALLHDTEASINELSTTTEASCPTATTPRSSISSIIIGNTSATVTSCAGNEVDKQIGILERRVRGLKRMLLGWEQIKPPDAAASVTVNVTGEHSVALQILEPAEGTIPTKFKVQWSTRADFSNIVGEREIVDWIMFSGMMGAQCLICGLTQGRRYFIRVASGNIKGWGAYRLSVPISVVPSSWRDLDNFEDRYLGRQCALDSLFTAVRLARPADAAELVLDPANVQKRAPKKKTTIKQLFSAPTKFQKCLKRGIYLASITYFEDKVLVTSDDFLPVIEIDDNYPSNLQSDYYWLLKVSCTWEDVKSLRIDMERNPTSALQFRAKLLSAICLMQTALGVTDLGMLHYKPIKDMHGVAVICCIKSVKSQKLVSSLNCRWLPLNKLQKKLGAAAAAAIHDDFNINELLISSISEQIHFNETALQRLESGLYLGYLKMQCSVEQIQVVVPLKTPNVLPHQKVRENSHVSAEEWQILKHVDSESNTSLSLPFDLSLQNEGMTEVQRLFVSNLHVAANKLFTSLNIKPDEAKTHRLYDIEVIEHSKNVTFLIICPPAGLSCGVPGQSDLLLQRGDLASLSIQIFELIHLQTYQPSIIQKYTRLFCILDVDTAVASHLQREAFSSSELQTAKDRLAKLQELSTSLNTIWKSTRWLLDVIAFARNKHAQQSLAMNTILEFSDEQTACTPSSKQLLQLPLRERETLQYNHKPSGTGRGSWPGPGADANVNASKSEFFVDCSKSEQNLGTKEVTPVVTTTLVVTRLPPTQQRSAQTTRKKAHASNAQTQHNNVVSNAVFAIPTSRSDDTLDITSQTPAVLQRKRSISNISQPRTTSTSTSTATTAAATTAAATPPQITIHNSSSVPSLSCEIGTNGSSNSNSNSSSKSVSNTDILDLEHKPLRHSLASDYNIRDQHLRVATTSSARSLAQPSSEDDTASCSSLNLIDNVNTGIIQVYTAYNTGLANGTSLKLHVTPKTTAREVINLVVKQLNMATVLKGTSGPIYTADQFGNFCLVAVIGARERCLRDDFKPLQLQNPWKKGRLYVRQKHELLAAIEHSNRKSQLI